MYVHPAFKADPAAVDAFVQSRGFGTFVAFDGTKPVAVQVPFLYLPEERRLEVHVARANSIHEVIADLVARAEAGPGGGRRPQRPAVGSPLTTRRLSSPSSGAHASLYGRMLRLERNMFCGS